MSESKDEEELTIATDIVVTKYKMAAEIVNKTLKHVLDHCKVGETVLKLCEMGDKMLEEETGKVFKKEKQITKGIAFPTCVSINSCICHFSPLKSDPEVVLKDGDMVKVDMGAHVDGFSAMVAHTIVVGASADNPVTGRKADAVWAAHQAAEACQRLLRPGGENYALTDMIGRVAAEYDCRPIEGMRSQHLRQHKPHSDHAVIQAPTEEERRAVERCEFELYDVWVVDVYVSAGGEGKPRQTETRTTVYMKKDVVYQLKMKASRQFLSEVCNKFHAYPFTIRALEDEKKARMGVMECANHQLVEPLDVLYEKDGAA